MGRTSRGPLQLFVDIQEYKRLVVVAVVLVDADLSVHINAATVVAGLLVVTLIVVTLIVVIA